MSIELTHSLCVFPIRPRRGEAIVFENGLSVLSRKTEKILERSPLVRIVGEDVCCQISQRFWDVSVGFLRCLKIFLEPQAPAERLGVEDAVGVRRRDVVCRGLISTAAFRFPI